MRTKPPEDADTTARTEGTTTHELGETGARAGDTSAADELAAIEREERAAAEERERAQDARFAAAARLRERAAALAALLDLLTDHPAFVTMTGAGASRFQSLVWLAHEQAERLAADAQTMVDGMGV